jgi:hypothetical protein
MIMIISETKKKEKKGKLLPNNQNGGNFIPLPVGELFGRFYDFIEFPGEFYLRQCTKVSNIGTYKRINSLRYITIYKSIRSALALLR